MFSSDQLIIQKRKLNFSITKPCRYEFEAPVFNREWLYLVPLWPYYCHSNYLVLLNFRLFSVLWQTYNLFWQLYFLTANRNIQMAYLMIHLSMSLKVAKFQKISLYVQKCNRKKSLNFKYGACKAVSQKCLPVFVYNSSFLKCTPAHLYTREVC